MRKVSEVPIQENNWCDLVSNYETDFDEVDYENKCLQFENCSMD